MTRSFFIVGTDTGVGKTTVCCALLQAARLRGLRVLPFKPACTGPLDSASDPVRLLRAAGLDPGNPLEIVAVHDSRPLAPGVAIHGPAASWAIANEFSIVERARAQLDRLIARHRPDLVLVEGAGGLRVPFPGPSWQTAWIRALAPRPLVVGRAGLGTLNHTLLTLEALQREALPAAGFLLSSTDPTPDPSAADNHHVIASTARTPHFGTLPHRAGPTTDSPPHWIRPEGITALFL